MIRGELAEHAARMAAERKPFVLATVVHAQRPTSVRPGDVAIVRGDGEIEGFVGGLCAESSVRLHALRALETGEALLLRLVPGAPGEKAPQGTSDDAIVERNPCLSGGSLEIFLEPQLPPPRIVVVGSSPIARAVRDLARAAGFEPGDLDLQPGDAAAIVASHGANEERVLAEALCSGIPYVALVASRTRGEAVRAALEVPDELRRQLHTPAGLAIGARTPREIAVAILAELIAEHHAHPAAVPTRATGASRDPICGMEVAVAETTPNLQTAGGRVYFCGERCRDAYAEQHAAELAAP